MSDTSYPGQGAGMREAFDKAADSVFPVEIMTDTELANAKQRADALREFESAAREAKRTQLAAQAAAKRYAAAVQRLSEVCSADVVDE